MMDVVERLPGYAELKAQISLNAVQRKMKEAREAELAKIITGDSNKFLLVVGPCSADDHAAVVEYTIALAKISEKVQDSIFIVPRVFTAKPRTTTTGYMGLIHTDGIKAVRGLHVDVIKASGLITADDLLYTTAYPYLDDIVSYFVIGARSVENQEHRLVASGIRGPVAMKNPTSGNLSCMVNAVCAARLPHDFFFDGCKMRSSGNPLAHGVLRGFERNGVTTPNYYIENLIELDRMQQSAGIGNPSVVIDVSHANSGKNHTRQADIALEVLKMRRQNPVARKLVWGLMIESYIEEGSIATHGMAHGRSVTDPCLCLPDTEKLILKIAEGL